MFFLRSISDSLVGAHSKPLWVKFCIGSKEVARAGMAWSQEVWLERELMSEGDRLD